MLINQEVLSVIESDYFIAKLWNVYETVYKEGIRQVINFCSNINHNYKYDMFNCM